MYCRKCGAEIKEGQLFCKYCGNEIGTTDENVRGIKGNTGLIITLSSFAFVLVIALVVILVVLGGSPEKRLTRQLELAHRYLGELDYEQAIASYEAALEIDPKCVDAYIGLAEVYEEMEDYEKASDVLRKGLEETGSKTIEKAQSKLEKKISDIDALSEVTESSDTSDERTEAERLEDERLEQERLEQERLEREELEQENRYREFVDSICGDDAISAYIDHFDREYGFSNISQGSCYCIYLNDDKVPELVVDGGDAASGAMIFTYGPDGVDEAFLSRGEFRYWEKENIIVNSSGNSGGYGDSIFEIKNGIFNYIAGGSYFIKEEYYNSSWDEDYMWNCVWEDEEVSYSDYMKIRDSYLPSGEGQWNNAFYIGIPVYGSYAFYDAYHELLIKWGEADYEDFGYGMEKPNIYIYPDISSQPVTVLNGEKVVETDVSLTIGGGSLTTSWPEPAGDKNTYNWHVYAGEDGTLYDGKGNEYSYLFWEGDSDWQPDFSAGFCVKGEDTAEFLRSTLKQMGLTPREYNEFIVYWAPRMQSNRYNLISFQGDGYNQACPLSVRDAGGNTPDSMLRVMMAWKPVDHDVTIKPQSFSPFDRNGFTVVEWGGRECK